MLLPALVKQVVFAPDNYCRLHTERHSHPDAVWNVVSVDVHSISPYFLHHLQTMRKDKEAPVGVTCARACR